MANRANSIIASIALIAITLGCVENPPSIVVERVTLVETKRNPMFEDEVVRFFVVFDKSEAPPGLYVTNVEKSAWIRILKLSTADAKFGRSPDFPDVPLSVGWDHGPLRNESFIDVPIPGWGTHLLPTEIEYDAATSRYRILFGSNYGEQSHPTIFVVPKDELKAAIR